ncbi:MAG: hypothetical protein ACFFAN_09890 [Promethearchaeota archaeon]
MKNQSEKFLEDYKTYGSGILLWATEEYPDWMLFISIFFGFLFYQASGSMLPGMKMVVDEYFAFQDEVKAKKLDLYNEELEKSNKMFFRKTIQPMDLLVAKDPYIKKINKDFIGILNILKPQIQDYSERIRPILTTSTEKLKEKTKELPSKEEFDSILRNIKSNKGSFTELIESLNSFKKVGEYLNKFPQELRKIIEETNRKIKEIQSETLLDIPKLGEGLKTLTRKINGIYDPNDPSWAYIRLGLIKDVDSFHIEFTKFIARLLHILSYNNREYDKKTPQIQIKPKKYYSNTRKILKKILEREMKEKYPKLSEYLLSMFKYNKYRKIEAHENPIVRIEDGVAYFSVKGTDKEVKMNLKETQKIHRTYSYFIKVINLECKSNFIKGKI